jgi:importin subunit alpha-6/7
LLHSPSCTLPAAAAASAVAATPPQLHHRHRCRRRHRRRHHCCRRRLGAGDDLQTQVIINYNALAWLLALLTSPKKGIRKEACWTISNITAGNKDQIQAVIDAGIVAPLIGLLANAEFDIRKEAAWAISNATSGGKNEQIKFLVQNGCIPPLCDLLQVQDAKIVTVALEGLENILKVRAGVLA